MPGIFWAVVSGIAVLAGVISYAMARRYGWGAALALPALALIAVIGMRWQEQDMTTSEGAQMAGATLAFAAPIILGVALGIVLARRRGRQN